MEHLLIQEDILSTINRLKEDGLTLVIVVDQNNVLGIFGIADELREESKSVT